MTVEAGPAPRQGSNARQQPLLSGRAAAGQSSPDGDLDGEGFADDDGGNPDMPKLAAKRQRIRNTAEEDNRRLHGQWSAPLADNTFRYTCWQAARSLRNAALHERLCQELARANLSTCPICSHHHAEHEFSTLKLSQPMEQNSLTYVAVEGRVTVPVPQSSCALCGSLDFVHPVMAGAFPATPARPQFCYAIGLLALAHEVCLAGPMPREALCSALEQMHVMNDCTAGQVSGKGSVCIWRHLGMAADQWWRIERASKDLSQYAVQPISPVQDARDQADCLEVSGAHQAPGIHSAATGGPANRRAQGTGQPAANAAGQHAADGDQQMASGSREAEGGMSGAQEEPQPSAALRSAFPGPPSGDCPCCYRSCAGAMADACLGLTHCRAAGSASDFLAPHHAGSPFIADEITRARLTERRGVDPASLTRPSCSDFVAASSGLSERARAYHIQVCP